MVGCGTLVLRFERNLWRSSNSKPSRELQISNNYKQTKDIEDFVDCSDCNALKDVFVVFRNPSIGSRWWMV
jgi:hypothetical protein